MPAWLTETSVIVGVIGLLGVLVGAFLRRKSESETHDLTVLKTTVETLRTDVDDLRIQVKELKKQVDEAEKEKRLAWEKYSASLSYIRLQASIIASSAQVLVSAGFTPPKIPDPPDNIREDMK